MVGENVQGELQKGGSSAGHQAGLDVLEGPEG